MKSNLKFISDSEHVVVQFLSPLFFFWPHLNSDNCGVLPFKCCSAQISMSLTCFI